MTDFLPEQHQFSHEFSLFLHDILVQTIKSGEEQGAFQVQFNVRSAGDAKELEALTAEALWDWLDRRDYGDIKREVAFRQTTLALLSDFCHFVYEALSCSRKAKLTVAYALLRKPFKDNLFYLERMVIDRKGFLDSLLRGGAESLDPNRMAPDLASKGQQIARTIAAMPNGCLYDPEVICALRYDKSQLWSFDSAWNKACHLVTTRKHLVTEPQNLNFIFLCDGVQDSQWDYLYSWLPLLLNYSVDVVEALVTGFAQTETWWVQEAQTRRMAGTLLWLHTLTAAGLDGDAQRALGVRLHLPCTECGKDLREDTDAIVTAYESGHAFCESHAK